MSGEGVMVMVVEDEEILARAIEKRLAIDGKKVVICSSAEDALGTLNTMETLPDLIWLDYYLKKMNGLEFMSQVKGNPKWANIPVIVVSNSASPEKVSQMLALGVEKYILKSGSRLEDLSALISEIVRK